MKPRLRVRTALVTACAVLVAGTSCQGLVLAESVGVGID